MGIGGREAGCGSARPASFLLSIRLMTSLGSYRYSVELDCKSNEGASEVAIDPSNGLVIVSCSDSKPQHVIRPDELFKHSSVSTYLFDALSHRSVSQKRSLQYLCIVLVQYAYVDLHHQLSNVITVRKSKILIFHMGDSHSFPSLLLLIIIMLSWCATMEALCVVYVWFVL